MTKDSHPHWSSRLPFYFGWVIIAVAFVTMAIGVTARTAFSFGLESFKSLSEPVTKNRFVKLGR